MNNRTEKEYELQISRCRELFVHKTQDYGISWRILRISSLIDQIFIKAQRIRSIEEKGEQKIADSIAGEYIGIINYALITLIQLELGDYFNISRQSDGRGDGRGYGDGNGGGRGDGSGNEVGIKTELPDKEVFELYDHYSGHAYQLMEAKNHDYGEAWRDMWVSSFTDLILSKLLRIRQILTNKGRTRVSEGIDANLYDIINYAVFALIRLEESGNA